MRAVHDHAENDVRDELTLGAAFRVLASAQLPSRFYQLLQFSLPLAFQFWSWGWRRSAAWMLVIASFGLWALCEQRLERERMWQLDGYGVVPKHGALLHLGRRVAGAMAGLVAAGLLIEGFVRFMSLVFKCPGCAG